MPKAYDSKSIQSVPIGTVMIVPTTGIPPGYLICDGSAISRSVYSDLFNAIGVAHGYGDQSSTFNIPDYRGRFLRGVDGSASRDPDRLTRTAMATGGSTGDSVGSVQGSKNLRHDHGVTTFGNNLGTYWSNSPAKKFDTTNANRRTGWNGSGDGVANGGVNSAGTAADIVIITSFDAGIDGESRPINVNVKYMIRFE